MTVNAFFTISFVCTLNKKMFVFITIKALFGFAISIVYFRCMHFARYYYFIVFDFVNFFYYFKSYYQNFYIFFFFDCKNATCINFNFLFHCLIAILNVVNFLKRNKFILCVCINIE